MKISKKKLAFVAVCMVLLLVVGLDARLCVQTYTVDADKIDSGVRIALVTDLHSCKYGKEQGKLIDALVKQSPDLVLLGGDIFDDIKEDRNTEVFLAGIADKFPCYYVTGNHEYWASQEQFEQKMKILEKYSIQVLSGNMETLTVNGETIHLCGVKDPDAYMVEWDVEINPKEYIQAEINKENVFIEQLAYLSEVSKDHYTILLSHRPEYYETYTNYDFDLVLCGHAHGGQWRLPGILNGLYAPNQGFFPEYAGGRYDNGEMSMIVSRGLARETTRVPRIFNRPELVIVDVK